MFPDKFKLSRGYTLLFSILIMTFIFSVTVSFFSITRNESSLSSAVHESLYALYAADTGMECAQYYDPATTTPLSVSCGDSVFVESPWNLPAGPGEWVSTFTVFFTEGNQSCARITLKKRYDINANLKSSIESRGYNLGESPECPINHPAVVERALRLTY